MVNLRNVSGAGDGLFFESRFATAMNRTGTTLAIGDVVMFDMGDTDAATTTTLEEGNAGSVFANVVLPLTVGIGALSGTSGTGGGAPFFFGVVVDLMAQPGQTAGGDDTRVKLQIQGVARVSMVATAISVGFGLVAANGVKTLTPTFAPGNKILAVAWEPNGSAAGVYTCLFDGLHGITPGPAAS